MADVKARTEDWNALPWTTIQRKCSDSNSASTEPHATMPMTMARILKSRMTGNCHVRFGSDGGAGARPTDPNLGGLLPRFRIRECVCPFQ